MTANCSLCWFRNDLRVADNPALSAAIARGSPVLALYVFDEAAGRPQGAAARWWLHHSLEALRSKLQACGIPLLLRRGASAEIVTEVARSAHAGAVFWNRRYYAPLIDADKALKASLRRDGVLVETFNSSLLREPWELKTAAGGPYKVYTPFWKALRQLGPAVTLKDAAEAPAAWSGRAPQSEDLSGWRLTPGKPDWAARFLTDWTPGESGAAAALENFFSGPIESYAAGRDYPAQNLTSRLSPHLAFGEISPARIWEAIRMRQACGDVAAESAEKFLSELAWRDFAYNILFYFPELPEKNLRAEFDHYPWRDDGDALSAWRRGKTGYPIVDAGMRELWRTGWMHNRVRMIAASFLIKHLQTDWRRGEEWFWDTLLDADIANNSAGWQWVAGSGADAAPYFRIFNPTAQGEKFDPDGAYVRRYVPELAKLPPKFIHKPWTAPADILKEAGITLGNTYPYPIIDHKAARERALAGYAIIKNSA